MQSSLQKFKHQLSNIDMTQGTPWKKLLLFTVPLLIGNFFQQMYNTADAIILGRFVGDNALAAVGVSIPIFFLVLVIMFGISMGSGIMVAQYFGAKKREELSRTVGVSLTIITVIGVVMMAAAPFVVRPLLVLQNTPAEILDDATMYMTILMVGVLGMAYFNILSGILRGMGDAFSPLKYLAYASVLNIIFNFILIPEPWTLGLFGYELYVPGSEYLEVVTKYRHELHIPGFGLGVWGAAVGTVVAQLITSLMCLRRLMQMRDVFDMGFKYLRPQKKYAVQVLKLGVPTAASQAVFAVAMMIIQPLANGMDYLFPGFLAANIIVMRIDGFIMMPNFSFGQAISVYVGQNIGAGKIDRIGIGVRQCIIVAFSTALITVSAVLLFGHHIAGIFTETEYVIAMSTRFLRILSLGYVVFAVHMVMLGAIRGAGDALTPFWMATTNTIFVRVPTAYLFVHFIGTPDALFFSLLAGWSTNTILGCFAYRFGKWRTKGIVRQQPEPDAQVSSSETPTSESLEEV